VNTNLHWNSKIVVGNDLQNRVPLQTTSLLVQMQ